MNIHKALDFTWFSPNPVLVLEVDRTGGYLGVLLGTSLAWLPGMRFVEQRGELAIFHLPTDSLRVGQAQAVYI